MNETQTLMIVDDEEIAVRNLSHVMRKSGYKVTTCDSGPQAMELLQQHSFDVVLTDLRMDGADGMAILQQCRERWPESEVIMITGFASLESAVAAMRQGAFFYIAKPFRLDEVRKVVAEAMEKVRLRRENRSLKEQLQKYQSPNGIISRDPTISKLLEVARQIGPSNCNVLITGASGVGKELFARYLHQHGTRPDAPFLAVNCGVFTEDLLANELFGHEKGAFTGAMQSKTGLVEAAKGGVLFLDEITEMSLGMQVKLLRVVQEREFMRVGGVRPIPADIRFIAATNRPIQEALASGRLRSDLYYRLNVVTLEIPPLQQRAGDIALLADHFLQRSAQRMHKPIQGISPEALLALQHYPFPGNVRELENMIERAVALCNHDTITLQHLPEQLASKPAPLTLFPQLQSKPTLEELEQHYIQWVLSECQDNQTLAAEILGIDRVSLWRKLKRLKNQETIPSSPSP
ncbi:sigma-54-dependent transcriptional regulator [Candidatus Magnetaquicoccus inordinatus]|uniref:sigma-54-dependent transcriptional regulator n=1 Tax=Candidatus Magnetaquicoccus inordinatus TaxID=2496818 RepID=UPI00102BFD1C|nr:sigma-54 dependent transcriptional regulator [Candidatus Magnetaquicoccus inordinatus]